MKKSEITKEIMENISGSTVNSLIKLFDVLIDECHVANETNRDEEYLSTQGEIKAFRKLKKVLTKKIS
jgi:hypothetical protein